MPEMIPLTPSPAHGRRQDSKHILLYYARKSGESTKALFETFDYTEEEQERFFFDPGRPRTNVVVKNRLAEHTPLADFLLLPSASLERVASHPQMTKAIDAKVTKRWAVVSLVFTGECIVVLIVCYGRLAYLLRLGVDVPRLAVPIAFAASAATPLFVLELVQMRAMHKQRLLLTWASSFWNQIDVLSVVWLPVMLIVAVRHGADDSTFKIVASIGGLVLMFKLLGFLKVLSVQLATFVLALGIILSDVRSFLAVLLVVMLGFGNAFWTLLGTKTLQLHDDEPDNVRSFDKD